MAPEKQQKHETFPTFGPRCAKNIEFLTLSGEQAGLGAPRVRKHAPAGARKTAKTLDFSHITARKCQKHSSFLTFGPICAKSVVLDCAQYPVYTLYVGLSGIGVVCFVILIGLNTPFTHYTWDFRVQGSI